LKEQLRADITTAMKERDTLRLGTLRMLSASVTNREKELRHELGDDELREVAAKEVKRRTEAIEAYADAGRQDLVEKETAEREVLTPYAPARLSEAEVDALIDEAFATTGASGPGDLGKVMGAVMAKAKGQVDGAAVQAKVRARLG
jgi:uncharacterized protein YqeY